ncbi:GNAT family N-acetyltransferase [Solobacterium moorei]|uniref:GNAT family N-acetyltransferase n=1 Tax=Solobacterium moorei TaxID=102148 RepID=UPI0024ACCA38|nr:GNAT family N-acetyltransferase [Solobacterium moorei]MDI6413974.1 GNAT family N-acetyltransferase [Solobacterium moorei]
MDVSLLSDLYLVQMLGESDIESIYELCRKNALYYQYCPPFVSEESIICDMNALPPNKDMQDKYYIGYYDGERLVAVMDLIMNFPDEKTAFIGFFMTDVAIQNTGIGSRIIDDLCVYLAQIGISKVRLGWVKDNPQAEHFWHKNKFVETGDFYDTDKYTVIVARRYL